ncbi:RAQPRD family integrative conjugative element protein [Klebsiella michiganensis]|uniref:integrative conjugative element protein, RAQPRD family n=2 Tax=Klebsiella michiganensis TaxID=1134687 RepID=UPI002FFCB5CE
MGILPIFRIGVEAPVHFLKLLPNTTISSLILRQPFFYPALNTLSEKVIMRSRSLFLLLTLLIASLVYASPESTQLALALKQLDGIKTSLERAQTSASTDPQSRYFFDYLQAQQDISAVEQGIRRYLSPARAQPRAVQPLSASYQREHPDD